MAENYKYLYEQYKNLLDIYQQDIIPRWRKMFEKLEAENELLKKELSEIYASHITDQTKSALEKMGQKTHREE